MARMRILVVEDERRVASFVSRALRENSYAVDLAETGEKAIEMATATTYDSILLDIRLPGLSGIQVCRELREARVDTPILMLTARGLVEQRVEGLDAGADDYLTKPFAALRRPRTRQARTAADTRRPHGYANGEGICSSRISHEPCSRSNLPQRNCRTCLGCALRYGNESCGSVCQPLASEDPGRRKFEDDSNHSRRRIPREDGM